MSINHINHIKHLLTVARSFVYTCDKSADLIQEQQALLQEQQALLNDLLNDLLTNDRFARLTKNNLKTALLALQECTQSLQGTSKNAHKDLTPSNCPYER